MPGYYELFIFNLFYIFLFLALKESFRVLVFESVIFDCQYILLGPAIGGHGVGNMPTMIKLLLLYNKKMDDGNTTNKIIFSDTYLENMKFLRLRTKKFENFERKLLFLGQILGQKMPLIVAYRGKPLYTDGTRYKRVA